MARRIEPTPEAQTDPPCREGHDGGGPVNLRTEQLEHLVTDRGARAGVIANHNLQIIRFCGAVDDYLIQPPGSPTQDLLLMARPGLRAKLLGAVRIVMQERTRVTLGGVPLLGRRMSRLIRFMVEPLGNPAGHEELLLVCFNDDDALADDSNGTAGAGPRIQQLETILHHTRVTLQSTIEELEVSNQELLSSNAELLATNHDLDSSRCEAQLLNEQLLTVNTELEGKICELERINNDLENLLISTDLATLFLDQRFRIRRYTPAMTRLVRLMAADIGRPIGDLAGCIGHELVETGTRVLQTLIPIETEIEGPNQQWYCRRMMPYRTLDNRVDGLVITFSDITARKQSEAESHRQAEELAQRIAHQSADLASTQDRLHQARVSLRAVVQSAAEGIITIDEGGTILSANPAAEQMFAYTAAELTGASIAGLLPGAIDAAPSWIAEALTRAGKDFEVQGRRKDNSRFTVRLALSELCQARPRTFVVIIHDLTEARRREAEVRQLGRALAEVAEGERRRIGYELHDQVGQILSGTAMLARSLERRLTSQGSHEARTAAQIVDQLRTAHHQVRMLARGLGPLLTFREGGLHVALSSLAESTRTLYNLECQYHGDERAAPADDAAAEHLYRIAQEAVANAVQHGHPSRIALFLQRRGANLELTVADDGCGIRVPPVDNPGLGLQIQRYRAELIGARLSIEPANGGGTLLRCVLSASQFRGTQVARTRDEPNHGEQQADCHCG